jgi:gamma-glutamylcyclotransferase (GGCT)/AIG2-like uncharacterized protein YtfP
LRLFAYGSNMSEIDALCPGAEYLGPARLDGRRLAFLRRSIRWGAGVADIAPDPGSHVWGALFELPDDCLAALDAKEGEGFAYRRVELELAQDGTAVQAQAYELIERAAREIPPRPEYVALLVEGARARGLPDDWIARLERGPVASSGS